MWAGMSQTAIQRALDRRREILDSIRLELIRAYIGEGSETTQQQLQDLWARYRKNKDFVDLFRDMLRGD